MNRERMTWGGNKGVTLPVERKASAHPATPDEGISHPAGYDDPTQPADYENGDTSSWAEDVHPGPYRTSPAPAVPVDDGGYKHPATQPGAPGKNASDDLHASVHRKASQCIRIASAMLGKDVADAAQAGDRFATSLIEDQALEFMDLPDSHVASTLRRIEAATSDPDDLLRKMLAADGEEVEEEEEKEDEGKTAGMSQVMTMLASLQAELASMKSGNWGPQAGSDEALLASMLQEEAAKVATPVAAGGDEAEAEAMLAAMIDEEAHKAEMPISAPAFSAPVVAPDVMLDEVPMEDDFGMGLVDDPMGLAALDDAPVDDSMLASLFAMKNAGEEEVEEEVEEEDEDAQKKAATVVASMRPQARKASNGPRTVGTQVLSASDAGKVSELAKLWDSAPDVSKIFNS